MKKTRKAFSQRIKQCAILIPLLIAALCSFAFAETKTISQANFDVLYHGEFERVDDIVDEGSTHVYWFKTPGNPGWIVAYGDETSGSGQYTTYTDADGSKLAFTRTGNGNYTSFHVDASSTYYVKATAAKLFPGDPPWYNFKIHYNEDLDGEIYEDATPIALNTIVHGSIAAEDDKDWFTFETGDATEYTFRFVFPGSDRFANQTFTVKMDNDPDKSNGLKLWTSIYNESDVSYTRTLTPHTKYYIQAYAGSGEYAIYGNRLIDGAADYWFEVISEDDQGTIPVSEAYFPDATFRAYVSQQFDLNQDGALDENERESADFIRIGIWDGWIPDEVTQDEADYIKANYQNTITSLQGIEYLTGLRWLFAPNMKNLSGTLNLSLNNQLNGVLVFNTGLTGLALGKQPNLTMLQCYDSKITSLDVSGCPSLEELLCDNSGLSSLNISGNTAIQTLNCSNNAIESLDVSGLTNLETLWCGGNQLSALNVTQNTLLKELGCESNQLTELDVRNNTLLTGLWAHENKLSEIDVTRNTKLETLNLWDNQLTTLNLKQNTRLTGLYVEWNQLTALDVGHLTHMVELECMDNSISSLDVSKMTSLVQLYCDGNPISKLDVSNCTKLERLSCCEDQLTRLDVSHNTKLEKLACYSNRLTELTLGNNSNLQYVWCDENRLTGLDLSGLPALICLSAEGNQIRVLDISVCPDLATLVETGTRNNDEGYYFYYTSNPDRYISYDMDTVLLTNQEEDYQILSLPASLISIEAEGFAGVAADVVIIPSGCASIASGAFAGCSQLKIVVFEGAGNISVANDAFPAAGTITIYAPAGAKILTWAEAKGYATEPLN